MRTLLDELVAAAFVVRILGIIRLDTGSLKGILKSSRSKWLGWKSLNV